MVVTDRLLVSPALTDEHDDTRISVRGVRRELWDWLYVESARARMPLGVLLNVLITHWQELPEADRQQATLRYLRPDRPSLET